MLVKIRYLTSSNIRGLTFHKLKRTILKRTSLKNPSPRLDMKRISDAETVIEEEKKAIKDAALAKLHAEEKAKSLEIKAAKEAAKREAKGKLRVVIFGREYMNAIQMQ